MWRIWLGLSAVWYGVTGGCRHGWRVAAMTYYWGVAMRRRRKALRKANRRAVEAM